MSASLSTLSRRAFLALTGAAAGSRAVSSFAATATPQPASTGVLPTFPRAQFLEAADLTALTGDEQCLLVSLQGQVNRRQPRLYFYWGTDTTNQTWLNTITVPHRTSTDPWEFLAKYRSEIRGAVVYDVNVPDTVNVATAIASMGGAVIATADLAKAHQLNVVEDLTGQFANGLAAYQWAFDNIWPKMPQRILTAIGGTNSVQVANVQWTTLLQVTQPVTDSSNKAVYTADLTPFLTTGGAVYVRWTDAYPSDGWGPSVDQVRVTADGNVIASFQPGSSGETPYVFDLDSSQTASGWRFSDGSEYFIYKFVPPTGTKKLTRVAPASGTSPAASWSSIGWFSMMSDTAGECTDLLTSDIGARLSDNGGTCRAVPSHLGGSPCLCIPNPSVLSPKRPPASPVPLSPKARAPSGCAMRSASCSPTKSSPRCSRGADNRPRRPGGSPSSRFCSTRRDCRIARPQMRCVAALTGNTPCRLR
jgi:hypothetical protein